MKPCLPVAYILVRPYGRTDLPPSLPLPPADPFTRIRESTFIAGGALWGGAGARVFGARAGTLQSKSLQHVPFEIHTAQ